MLSVEIERGVERARPRGVEELVAGSSSRSASQTKMRSTQKYCAPTFGAQVLPLRVLRIGGRLDRVRPDVAEAAATCRRGTAAPGPCAVVVAAVRRSSASRPTSPRPPRRSPDWGRDAGRRCRWRSRSRTRPAAFLPRAPISTPGYFSSFSNGSGGQSARALVEPEAEALGVGAGRLLEAGLVDEAEVLPAVVAAEPSARGATRSSSADRASRALVRERSSQKRSLPPVHTIQVLRPVTSSGVSAHAAVHVVEVVLVRGGRTTRPFASRAAPRRRPAPRAACPRRPSARGTLHSPRARAKRQAARPRSSARLESSPTLLPLAGRTDAESPIVRAVGGPMHDGQQRVAEKGWTLIHMVRMCRQDQLAQCLVELSCPLGATLALSISSSRS